MKQRQSTTRLGAVKGTGRATREYAERPAPGWPALILRVVGSGLLIATAAIHLDLYLTGYRTIPTIGWLFLLQVIAAFGLGLAVLTIPRRLVIAGRLAAAAGAGFALATLGGYLLSVWTGLFGFKEVRTTAGIAAGVVEVAAFVVLAALALAPAANAPADGTEAAPARFPAQIPPTAARTAGMTATGLAVAALVLFGLVVAGASSPAPAATSTGLKTITIGGITVLANAKGFTLYSFAPDTAAASKCYGSCAVYWPPVTGTAVASPDVPAGSAQSSEPAALNSSPTTGTRCTPTSATQPPARRGATTSTSTADYGTKCLPPCKRTATEAISPGTSRACPGPAKENHRWPHRAICGSPTKNTRPGQPVTSHDATNGRLPVVSPADHMAPMPGWLTETSLWALVIRHARCSDGDVDPDQWFPVSADPRRARQEAAGAIAICATCPVRGHCLTLSLRHWDIGQHGVWGGLIAADRARLRRGQVAAGPRWRPRPAE